MATVRRATTMSALRSRATMTSSDKHVVGVLRVDHLLDLVRTDSAEWASPAAFEAEAIEAVKKYFISNRPRGVWMNLLRGGARDGRFVDADRVGDGLQVERLQAGDALDEEAVLAAHDLGGDVEDGARALLQALGQPVRALQVGRNVLPVLVARGAAADRAPRRSR